MARQTPAEKLAEVQALRSLGYYREIESARLEAKKATSRARAELSWQDRVASAKALLSMDSGDIAAILEAESLMATARGKGEARGQIEAATEAGVIPAAAAPPALPPKGNGKSSKAIQKSNN
jgi:hypothetical protein